MTVTNSSSLVSVQDGAGAVASPATGANVLVTPGNILTFSLVSTTGVARWDLSFNCPAYPALHGKLFMWMQGMANSIQVPMPYLPVGGTNSLNGIQVNSAVSDGAQTIGSSTCFLQTRGAGNNAMPMQNFARACAAAALASYTIANGVITITATGALASVDGVTLVAGDVMLLPNGLAASAADAGLYVVTNAGGTGIKAVLTAVNYGQVMLPKTEILVSEGTLYAGTTWVNTLTGLTNLVGTASFTFYPREVIQTVTLSASAKTITNVPILSATQSTVHAALAAVGGTTTGTIGYGIIVAPTNGALGTASTVVNAIASGGTKNGTADTSQLIVSIRNMV